jgi:hypothetical protein
MSSDLRSRERTMESILDKQRSVALYSPYWLVVRHDGLRMSVFTLELAGCEKVLPVFGHVEEAETFLLSLRSSGWQIRETRAGELVSVLFGPCANVGKVALDPPAPRVGAEELVILVSWSRKDFVELLTSGAEARAL